jgi:hypothetical protein
MHVQNASIQTRAAHGQRRGKIDHPDHLLAAAPEMSDPNSNGSEKPGPLEFSTGDPKSESDALVTGLLDDSADGVLLGVDAGLYPTVEL